MITNFIVIVGIKRFDWFTFDQYLNILFVNVNFPLFVASKDRVYLFETTEFLCIRKSLLCGLDLCQPNMVYRDYDVYIEKLP